MMNRKDRRAYLDRMRKDQAASLCPACKRKTRHMTIPAGDGVVDVVCEMCEKTVKAGLKGVPPYIFCKV